MNIFAKIGVTLSLVRGATSVPEGVGECLVLFSSFCVFHSVKCRGSVVTFM